MHIYIYIYQFLLYDKTIFSKDSSYADDLQLSSNPEKTKESKNETNISEESEIEDDISKAASGATVSVFFLFMFNTVDV